MRILIAHNSYQQRGGEDAVVENERDLLAGAGHQVDLLLVSNDAIRGPAAGVKAALIVASEEAARRHGLTPRARIVASATAGVAPRVMGIGPIPATRKLLSRAGVAIGDVDLFEINEAFAAQVLAVTRGLGLADDAAHVNPNGGAIAIGHPLGASGARLVTTATYQLARTGGRHAVCTMCIGVGQGIALLLERV